MSFLYLLCCFAVFSWGEAIAQAMISDVLGESQASRCFSVHQEVLANGNGQSLGYFRVQVSVMESAGSALVSFSVSMPDTPQLLVGDQIKATRVSPTTYKFRFIDGWDNNSRGLLVISGKHAKLTLVVDKFGPNPSGIARNYGKFSLNSSACK